MEDMKRESGMIESNISEKNTFNQLLDDIKRTKRITDIQTKRLDEAFGKRFGNAYKTIDAGRVRKYLFHPSERVVWIVAGREGEYQILPSVNFCSCDDFYFRVMDKEIHLCYHLIAQKMAEALKWYDLFEEDDELYNFLMEEWKRVTV